MNPPPKPDPLLVIQRHGYGPLYWVVFKDGVPYPWNQRRGLVRNVNWDNWEPYPRIPVNGDNPDTATLAGGAGGAE